MKAQFFFLMLTALVIASCSGKKTIAAAENNIPKETSKEADLTPELMMGKNLYENSCAKCHKLYNPKEYIQEDWKPILIRMQKKAHLDDTQMVSISNYITSQL